MAVVHRSEILIGENGWLWQCFACYEGGTEATEDAARQRAAEHEDDPGVDDSDLITAGLLAEEGEDEDDEDDGYGDEGDW